MYYIMCFCQAQYQLSIYSIKYATLVEKKIFSPQNYVFVTSYVEPNSTVNTT